jgi:bis(5'-nucleosyl)-tetraphosphatase (symmetrical)
MAHYAIGDVQGCAAELRALLARLRFRSDRDRLWFVGDLVNRGPDSVGVLRFVRALGDNAVVVLGNHDLHLLALVLGTVARPKRSDTLDDVLEAPDRDALIEWLLTRPLGHRDPDRPELLIHAGLLPQWSVGEALSLAAEVGAVLRSRPREFLDSMYGNQPARWHDALRGPERWRCVINALTRLRYCNARGVMDLSRKQAPSREDGELMPWFRVPGRASAGKPIVFGHWSTLGFVDTGDVVALDTGCVWGGSLTAWSLDERRRYSEPCAGHQPIGTD